ncbi:unnamed protein product [Microthlaspi erraticum]|uniref:Prolamin-like domain-containing protein n=1 Tax=Microthlaspi erraticum TaxID=1685480 RepID=A0A6D2HYX2_9BRAS|nr:unnamed protein product [Microthlaspi erraticum]
MSIKSVFFLLVDICITVSVNAQLPQFPFLFPFQPSPGMPGMPDITKCLSTLMNVPGCLVEISQSVLTGKFGSIGRACCKAFLEAEANCTPNLPFNPFFPPMLKQQCTKTAGPPTTL